MEICVYTGAMPRKNTDTPRGGESETVGQRLARLRKERGWTQVELAERIGIIQSLISDYERDRLPLEEFLEDARGLLPELHLEDLRLAYSGLRPKLVPPSGHGMADFVITRDPTYPRAIHLVGIESPGLTSAPAIARHVAALVSETLD